MTDAAEVVEGGAGEEVIITTLFMSGLPIDLQDRELHNTLRFFDGYKHSVLNFKSKAPTAFIAFNSVDAATAGKEKLEGIAFDSERPEALTRIEWAKSNSTGRTNRPRKRPRAEDGGMGAPAPHSQQQWAPRPPAPSAGGGGGGSTTLFVGNLGEQPESLLSAVFQGQPGMRVFKYSAARGNKGAVAFVDFETSLQASSAMNMLQGSNGGLRIEVAKNSMGRKGEGQAAPQYSGYHNAHPHHMAAAAAAAAPYGYGAPPAPYGMVYPPASPY